MPVESSLVSSFSCTLCRQSNGQTGFWVPNPFPYKSKHMSLCERRSVWFLGGWLATFVGACGGAPPSPAGPPDLEGAHAISGIVTVRIQQ